MTVARKHFARDGYSGAEIAAIATDARVTTGAIYPWVGRTFFRDHRHQFAADYPDSAGHGGFLFDNVIFPLLLKKMYADKNRQEAIVRDSGLDWILVRPSVLNDKPRRGSVRALADLLGFHGGGISRADVATFVLDQLRADAWLHRAPLITW
jgi:hypothetical protein